MADDDKDELEEKAKDGKGGKNGGGGSKTLLIVIIAAFLLFMLVAGAGFFILWKKLPGSANTKIESAEQTTKKEKSPQIEVGPVLEMQAFVVNLADPEGNRFLRVKMSLEIKDQELLEKMDKQRVRLRDKILTILSSKKYLDVNSVQGKSDLRAEIITALDGIFGKGAVKNVYFSEFVVE